ncbi:multicopper oxidase domain-containing protein [Lysinibacillus sp. BW-2-10]|uniref:multicopper oxidase domain-containing protein n=1 Tax=Lysinibacillus sp. BW-2-10 TaxID=2590030 RepID=UPI00117C71D3|nr:multicopper oxidase domain-containing protein [Lysinibacillus sp. BW-2-10]TSI06690.1 copper oxidase [Lysinibacillus sp. BW-2-10]
MLRKFHIVAIPIRIVVNRFGDHDPDGMMYVLKENESRIKKKVELNPFSTVDEVEPLVIRANVGDEIEVLFENQLPFNTGIHIQSVEYDVMTSDGAFVGLNKDTTIGKGETILYKWEADVEGIHFFADLGNPLSSEQGSNVHGLFGALFVEPRGSWWTDPITGKPINSGANADVHNPLLPSFREYGWFFHDEMEVDDLTGQKPISPHTLQPEATHLVNYRAEPMRNRMRLIQEGVVCPDCEGEEVHHDSWVFGDPDTPILRAYVGDPIKIRLVHGGTQETHSFHYHVHQWLFEATDMDSEIVDVQAISPQAQFTVSPMYGAGSLHGAIGDAIIHCHLYPHFGEGMWGMQRTFDALQDGTICYPNGVQIKALQPLPDRPLPPKPTLDRPGFPNFIPGIPGFKAPRPPLGIENGREPTIIERNHFAPNAVPGAVFVNPAPENAPVRNYDVVLMQMPIVYNNQGWHDPEGRLYVLAEDEEDVRCGRKKPEPLVIRANAGEVVRFKYTNKLPETIGGNAFQLVNRTYEAGMHVHFVKFDVLVADGANVGWNYDSGILPGETIEYQWYADVELKCTFWHDHLFANEHQQHGVFASINIQARGSEYLDPYTGKEIHAGTQAMITNKLIPDFREINLFVHDFALLFDKDGCPLNPPPFPGSPDDPGVMGVNYRNEPIQFRLKEPDCDPAYVFSSWVHGDPVTPLLETYNGDPVRVRLIQGAHEESHSFNLHRQRWYRERPDLDSELDQQQHIVIAETFTLEFNMEGEGDFDMLYHFGTLEDIWLGNWGIFRSYEKRVKHLKPLPDREVPEKREKPLPKRTGKKPPMAVLGQYDYPPNAKVRKYEVVALNTRIDYNDEGDHDPFGIVFALKKDVKDILSGKLNPEPLIIRANVGEYVEVTLTNNLTGVDHHDGIHGYPEVPVDAFFPPSNRISMHAQLVQYDVRHSDGATVGFNDDQTIGPGESITYRWYIDQDIGCVNLWDMADIRNHRHHGAFGMLIAEPRGSKYLDSKSRKEVTTGSQVIISTPLLPEFREFALLMHDGVRLLDKNGELIIDPDPLFFGEQPEEEEPDFEDRGSRGFNYRYEPFRNRVEEFKDIHKVFSSKVYEDPSTPVFLAYPNDPVIFRLTSPADRARARSFVLHGHKFNRSEDDINSSVISVRGQYAVGGNDDFHLHYGAGSLFGRAGDYMYRSGNIRWDVELGLWGIFRVLEHKTNQLAPLEVYSENRDDKRAFSTMKKYVSRAIKSVQLSKDILGRKVILSALPPKQSVRNTHSPEKNEGVQNETL